jgi:TolB-like protein
MDPIKKLAREAQQRSFWQVLGIYLAASWVALQVVETIVDSAQLPEWLPAMALVLLVIGLPIVVATAIAQVNSGPVPPEMLAGAGGDEATAGSPEGTDIDAAPAPGPASTSVGGSAPGGAAQFLTWKFAIGGGVAASLLWASVATVLLVTGAGRSVMGSTGNDGPLAIAVLPFASAGSTDDDESFALGIHDDVLTQLSKVGSFRVISRTSVMEYKDYTERVSDIARNLGADLILEGSVQRAGDQLHMNAQLIDTRDAENHLWAESYDRTLTVENIFLIQQDLARQIASALDATLTPEEAFFNDTATTENLEAYRLYQRANNYFNVGPRSQNYRLAFDLFQQATDLDPTFAQAYARHALARARAFEVSRRLGSLDDAKRYADLALALDPDNGEAHLALGQYYYTAFRDYERALEQIELARRSGLASSVDLHHNLAAVQRRMGDMQGAIASFQAAVDLDPLSSHLLTDLATTYTHVRDHETARELLRRAITLSPDTGPYTFMFETLANLDGSNTARMRALIQEREEALGNRAEWMEITVAQLEGDYERAFQIADEDGFGGTWIGALAAATGRDERARREFEGAEAFLTGRVAELSGDEVRSRFPQLANSLIDLAHAQVGLGRNEEAAASAEAAMEALPVSVDAMDGPGVMYEAAAIMAMTGNDARSIELLTEFFSGPGEQTRAALAADSRFDGLVEHPGFMQILTGG